MRSDQSSQLLFLLLLGQLRGEKEVASGRGNGQAGGGKGSCSVNPPVGVGSKLAQARKGMADGEPPTPTEQAAK
jgi:hypothetical protein